MSDKSPPRVPPIQESPVNYLDSEYFLTLGNHLESGGELTKAFQLYMSYIDSLKSINDIGDSEREKIVSLAIKVGSVHETMNEEDLAMRFYLQVMNLFPTNAPILNTLGLQLYKNGEFGIAKRFFKKAAAQNFLPAEKNLLHTYWNLIPRWHFRMMNDKARNTLFERAIKKAMLQGYTNVLDIGTGCGLLSLIAARANPNARVVGYEENKILHEMALDILKENKITNVVIHRGNSQNIDIALEPSNLIVTEIFDAGFFGEGCLDSIYHAVNTFTEPNSFQVIPSQATMYVTGCRCDRLRMKARVIRDIPDLGLEDCCVKMSTTDYYDAEYLSKEHVKYVTETMEFLNVDFYDTKQMYSLLKGESIEVVELKCLEDGQIDFLAVWFDLDLDDDIGLSTNPKDGNVTCWEQAIYHLNHPIKVKKGQTVRLQPKMVTGDSQLTFSIIEPQTKCDDCFYVRQDIVRFLNDEHLTGTFVRLAESYSRCDIKVLDFNVFPLFGFLMAKKGATVYHVYKDPNDLILFGALMVLNEINHTKMVFIAENTLADFMIMINSVDVVLNDYLNSDGSWQIKSLDVECERILEPMILPQKLHFKAKLIRSDYLDYCNTLDDENTLGFKVSKFLNEYSGNEHPFLENLAYESFSNPIAIDVTDMTKTEFAAKVVLTEDGSPNAIYYWFDMKYSNDDETSNFKFSTLKSTYYHKSCTYFNSPQEFKKGTKLTLKMVRDDSNMKVYCEEVK